MRRSAQPQSPLLLRQRHTSLQSSLILKPHSTRTLLPNSYKKADYGDDLDFLPSDQSSSDGDGEMHEFDEDASEVDDIGHVDGDRLGEPDMDEGGSISSDATPKMKKTWNEEVLTTRRLRPLTMSWKKLPRVRRGPMCPSRQSTLVLLVSPLSRADIVANIRSLAGRLWVLFARRRNEQTIDSS